MRLFEAGFSDSPVILRSGHRDLRSFGAYKKLQGKLGKDQQQDLFGDGDCYKENKRIGKRRKMSHGVGNDVKTSLDDEIPTSRPLQTLQDGTQLQCFPVRFLKSSGSINGIVSVKIFYVSGRWTKAKRKDRLVQYLLSGAWLWEVGGWVYGDSGADVAGETGAEEEV